LVHDLVCNEVLWQEGYGKGSWFGRYESKSLVGRDQYDWGDNLYLAIYKWWSSYALSKHERVSEGSCEMGRIGVG
jgi:hypothetical protein